MERRSLLIGSGAAFVTVLAGCTGSESDDGGDDDPDGGVVDDDDGGDDDGGNGGDDGENGDDDGSDSVDVPGFDGDKLDWDELEEHGVTVDHVKRDGEKIHVEVRATEADLVEENLEKLLDVVAAAIDDPETFEERISSIEVSLVDESGETVVSLFVDVEWAVAYVREEISLEEFADEVRDTAE